jgi:hypothetical protein
MQNKWNTNSVAAAALTVQRIPSHSCAIPGFTIRNLLSSMPIPQLLSIRWLTRVALRATPDADILGIHQAKCQGQTKV